MSDQEFDPSSNSSSEESESSFSGSEYSSDIMKDAVSSNEEDDKRATQRVEKTGSVRNSVAL